MCTVMMQSDNMSVFIHETSLSLLTNEVALHPLNVVLKKNFRYINLVFDKDKILDDT